MWSRPRCNAWDHGLKPPNWSRAHHDKPSSFVWRVSRPRQCWRFCPEWYCFMKKTVWCDRSIIKLPTYFGLCTTEKLFRRELRAMKLPKEDWPSYLPSPHAHATAHFFDRPSKEEYCIVTLRDTTGMDPISVAGLLVHESVHIWQNYHERIGEHTPSHEFEAYAVQWISQSLMWDYVSQTKNA